MIPIRLGFLIVGVAAFAYAMRTGTDAARWVGIVCVAVALVLRFWRRRGDGNGRPETGNGRP